MKRTDFTRAYALIWAVTLTAAALTVFIPGAASVARDAFGFRLEKPDPGSLREAARYFGANVRVVTAVLLMAWARGRLGSLRYVIDGAVAIIIVSNGALVGAALGAYGLRTVPWLVHLPAEWAALACVLATYAGTSPATSTAMFATAAAGANLLLAAAAVLEGYAVRW